jgi:hypothetical protein
MNRIVLTVAVIALFIACNNSKTATGAKGDSTTTKTDATSAPVITFEQTTYDFGEVTDGEKVSYEFKFKNTGKTPLIISNAMASCGCTVPDYPHVPIAPGANGVISVVFNSTGKPGKQSKVITLTSNAVPPTTELYLTGNVKQANK